MNKIKESLKNAVLITGAAGGIGSATAKIFSDKGYNVVATDIDTSKLDYLDENRQVMVLRCDVTKPGAVRKLYSEIKKRDLNIGIIISCAGIYETYPVTEADTDTYRKIMEVNFLSHQYLLSTFIRDLTLAEGRFVVVSSESIKLPVLFQPYMISKIALEAFAVTARQELALKGAKVIIVRPGAVNTGLLDWMKGVKNPVDNSLFEEEFEKSYHLSTRLSGRPVSPEKVAETLLRAATAKKSRKEYNVNHNPLLSLISMIPYPLLEKIITRNLRKKKPATESHRL